jgi:hypothetical protein
MDGQLDTRQRSALHEAGHMVILHLMGGRTLRCALAADGHAQAQWSFALPPALTSDQAAWWAVVTAFIHADHTTYPALHGRLMERTVPTAWAEHLSQPVMRLLEFLWAGEIAEAMAGDAAGPLGGTDQISLDRIKIAALELATPSLLRPGQVTVSERGRAVERLARVRGDVLHVATALYEHGELDADEIEHVLLQDTQTSLSPLASVLGVMGIMGLGGVLLDEVADSFDWFDS